MKALNEIASWIFEEISIAETQLPKGKETDAIGLTDRIVLLNEVLDQIRQAAHREEKRQGRDIRGFWNKNVVFTEKE